MTDPGIVPRDTSAEPGIRVKFQDELDKLPLDSVHPRRRGLRLRYWVALVLAVALAAALLAGIPLLRGRGPWKSSGAPAQPAASALRPAVAQAATGPSGPRDEIPEIAPAEAGRLAYDKGDYQDVLARAEAALARDATDAESMSNAAQVLIRLGRIDEAVALFDGAAKADPDRWIYQFNLARACDLGGRLDQSVKAYQVANALLPNDYATVFNLGRVLHRQGNDVAAVDQYQRAISILPSDPRFHLALALSLDRMGSKVDAAAAYRRFLDLAPDSPDAGQVRSRIEQLEPKTPESADTAEPR
jgi:tetratricopeptide (TPR) repeat protein